MPSYPACQSQLHLSTYSANLFSGLMEASCGGILLAVLVLLPLVERLPKSPVVGRQANRHPRSRRNGFRRYRLSPWWRRRYPSSSRTIPTSWLTSAASRTLSSSQSTIRSFLPVVSSRRIGSGKQGNRSFDHCQVRRSYL